MVACIFSFDSPRKNTDKRFIHSSWALHNLTQ
jgi:hypothetical protein